MTATIALAAAILVVLPGDAVTAGGPVGGEAPAAAAPGREDDLPIPVGGEELLVVDGPLGPVTRVYASPYGLESEAAFWEREMAQRGFDILSRSHSDRGVLLVFGRMDGDVAVFVRRDPASAWRGVASVVHDLRR